MSLTILLKRLLGLIPVIWIIATATFFLVRLAPGGPFDQERKIPEEILKNINAKYHLDEPLHLQYIRYLNNLLHGDLGPSFRYASYTVNQIIAETWFPSVALGFAGMFYALCLGVAAGMFAASKPNSWRDYTAMGISVMGVCLPSFVIGPLFLLVFAIGLRWFDVSGFEEPRDLVLPAMSLGTIYAAYISRLTRGGMLEMVRQDFVRTARAKGLSSFVVMTRHCLKGGLIPLVSFLGPATAGILSGSFVIETIFNIPGMGRFFVQSALNRDYTLVVGMVLVFSVLLLVLNLLSEVMHGILDPRVTLE